MEENIKYMEENLINKLKESIPKCDEINTTN
jgi:hypothetical protein